MPVRGTGSKRIAERVQVSFCSRTLEKVFPVMHHVTMYISTLMRGTLTLPMMSPSA